ncbi:MAG: nickel transporter permease NikB [Peptococcaceae bacterium BRH_c4b]|nr:MAG: nickel transporter permease NikB [Peptococcaceae bacterium BRH_c4b]
MANYIINRLLQLIPVLVGVSLITFFILNLAPGDPAELMVRASGMEPTPEAVASMREELGLNYPLHVRYCLWVWHALHGDLGVSYHSGLPVARELALRFPATLQLALASSLFMILLALPAGLLSAFYNRSYIDHLSRFAALLGASMPGYWLGLILIYIFGVRLGLLPVMGSGTIKHLLLPAMTLGFGLAAVYARLLRASLLEVMGQDYIKAARARGLRERRIMLAYAFKNALLPVVTAFGMSLGHLLGGMVVVETIFSWPGVGRLSVEAIFARDYPVLQGYVLVMALVFVVVNLLVDLSYVLLNPRLRIGGGEKR